MKLLFKQKIFSWLDSYNIFDEDGNTVYTVKGKLAWGHCFKIYNGQGEEIGTVKEEIFTLLPRFALYLNDRYIGSIQREFSFFHPRYRIDYNGWQVQGNWLEWDYQILNSSGDLIADISKQIWNWSDTYVIDVYEAKNALCALMLVLAIDAEKCSRRD